MIEASDGTMFYAHTNILGFFTDFFLMAMKDGFLEATVRRLKLPDHQSSAVTSMLKFCYTGHLPINCNLSGNNDVYFLADYVMMEHLKMAVVENITGFFANVSRYPTTQTKTWWGSSVAVGVRGIYEGTNAGLGHAPLRKAYVAGCRDCILAGLGSEPLERLIEENGEFIAQINRLAEATWSRAFSHSGALLKSQLCQMETKSFARGSGLSPGLLEKYTVCSNPVSAALMSRQTQVSTE